MTIKNKAYVVSVFLNRQPTINELAVTLAVKIVQKSNKRSDYKFQKFVSDKMNVIYNPKNKLHNIAVLA